MDFKGIVLTVQLGNENKKQKHFVKCELYEGRKEVHCKKCYVKSTEFGCRYITLGMISQNVC